MQKFKRALFVGRFQPFHLGHMKAVEFILPQTEELVIAVGSAQYSYEAENPYSSGERLIMIRNALKEAKVDAARYMIVPVPDLHRPRAWVYWTVSLTGDVDAVFSNDPIVKTVFKEAKYRVLPIPIFSKETYSGTEIRRRMRTGEDWQELVPKAVASYIEAIDGASRIALLGESNRSRSNEDSDERVGI